METLEAFKEQGDLWIVEMIAEQADTLEPISRKLWAKVPPEFDDLALGNRPAAAQNEKIMAFLCQYVNEGEYSSRMQNTNEHEAWEDRRIGGILKGELQVRTHKNKWMGWYLGKLKRELGKPNSARSRWFEKYLLRLQREEKEGQKMALSY